MTRTMLLIALGVVLIALFLTGCQSSGLAGTCNRFNMITKEVTVYAVDSDELGASKIVTKFQCVPKKYKESK